MAREGNLPLFLPMKSIKTSLVFLVPVLALSGCSSSNLNGAGATFPNPLYQRWFTKFSTQTGHKVNYQSVGSGAGIRQFVNGTIDFAATDEPIKAEETSKVGAGVVQIPLTAGTIAIAYNKPSCSLRLSQQQLVSIFDGSTQDWKQLGCSKGRVVVVHRSDGSGTTSAFTRSLSAFSPSWAKKFGDGKSVNFPVGVASKGNEGVAATIKTTPGSIGYVNLAYAQGGGLQVAALQNAAGNYVLPTARTGKAALEQTELNPRTLAGHNPNPAGANSYPLTSLTWVLAYRTQNQAKTETLKALLSYSLSSEAQSMSESLGYVPLSSNIRYQSLTAINQISK